eukprot:gene1705-biopygen1689
MNPWRHAYMAMMACRKYDGPFWLKSAMDRDPRIISFDTTVCPPTESAASFRYSEMIDLSAPETPFIALFCAAEPTLLTESPMLTAGRWPPVKSLASR